jgi:hypothetical protein
MGFMNLFRGKAKADGVRIADRAIYAAAALKELDIDNAVVAHENWSLRLQAYVRGKSSEAFDPAVACSDKHCDLGKWIQGHGREQFEHVPAFEELVSYHKSFHYHASNIVTLHQMGETAKAEKVLDGKFKDLSWRVVNALNELRREVQRF